MIEGRENLKTTLSDDSALYAKPDTRTTKQKWKELDRAGKLRFFMDYICLKLIASIAGVAILIYIIYSIVAPKPEPVLNVAIMNTPFTAETVDAMEAELSEAMVTDPKREEVVLDTSYLLSVEEYSVRMKIMASLAARDLDCMILPLSELQTEVNGEACMVLTEFLPKELLDRASSRFVYATYTPDPMKGDTAVYNEEAYGIDISDLYEKEYGVRPDKKYVLCVVINTRHDDRCLEFIEYILDRIEK